MTPKARAPRAGRQGQFHRRCLAGRQQVDQRAVHPRADPANRLTTMTLPFDGGLEMVVKG